MRSKVVDPFSEGTELLVQLSRLLLVFGKKNHLSFSAIATIIHINRKWIVTVWLLSHKLSKGVLFRQANVIRFVNIAEIAHRYRLNRLKPLVLSTIHHSQYIVICFLEEADIDFAVLCCREQPCKSSVDRHGIFFSCTNSHYFRFDGSVKTFNRSWIHDLQNKLRSHSGELLFEVRRVASEMSHLGSFRARKLTTFVSTELSSCSNIWIFSFFSSEASIDRHLTWLCSDSIRNTSVVPSLLR